MIIRGPREHGYTTVPRATFEDSALSFEARGLLAYLLVKPNDWRVSQTDLQRQGGIGRDKVRGLINALVDAGYMTKGQRRDKSGKLGPNDYVVYDEPQPLTEMPSTAEPSTAEPSTANPAHTKDSLLLTPNKNQEVPSTIVEREPAPRRPAAHILLVDAMYDAWGYSSERPRDYVRNARDAKALLDLGYTAADIRRTVKDMLTDPFWRTQPISMTSVRKRIERVVDPGVRKVAEGRQRDIDGAYAAFIEH